MLAVSNQAKFHPRVVHDIKRELGKVLARFGTTDNQTTNTPKNNFEESLRTLISLTKEECYDHSIFDDIVLLLSSKRSYKYLSVVLQNSLIKNFKCRNLWYQTGIALMSVGKYQEALIIFKECLTYNSGDPNLLLLCSKIYLNYLNDPEKALECVSKVQKPNDFWKIKCNLHFGIIYSQLSYRETSLQGRQTIQVKSLDYLLGASQLDDNDSMINYQIAIQYAELREIKKAFHFVKKSLQNQSHIQGWILLANLYSSVKEFSNVSTTIKTALFEFPNNIQLLLLQAEVEELENETKAFKSFKTIVDSLDRPENEKYSYEELEIFLRITNSYRRMKRFTEALDLMKKKKLEELGAEYHFINGRILEDTKKLTEALEEYQNCIILHPNHFGAQERMGVIYSNNPQTHVLAKSYLQSSVRLNPTSFEAWYHLGVVTKKMGDFEEASDSFITSIKLQKTSPLIPYSSIKRNI